jgi:hypothetical protein
LAASAPAAAGVGKNITVVGKLTNGTTALKTQTITLQRSLDNKTWANVTTPANKTNASGGYSLVTNEVAAGTHYYRAYYAGSTTYAASASKGAKVVVS